MFPVHGLARIGRLSALCGNLDLPMHRAARSATADHVRVLLQQLLFVHRAKLLATRLQYQLEETINDLDDIGFDEQVLSGVLRTAHLEISGFIARCDQAMLTTEQRILRILVR